MLISETDGSAARSFAMRLDFDAAHGGLLHHSVHEQVAAIPVRALDGAPRVLLVTTRGKGRWTAPKGWPIGGAPNCQCAAREAYEEAGVSGEADPLSLGQYSFTKKSGADVLRLTATAFLLRVTKTYPIWPERAQRMRTWFPLQVAQSLVNNDELAALLQEAVRRFTRLDDHRTAADARRTEGAPQWVQ